MRRILPLIGLLMAAAFAPAQSLGEYLKLRKQYGITQAVGVEALETLIGTRVMEIKGVVKGTFTAGDRTSLLLERSDGDTQIIDATKLPGWLFGNEVHARMIIKATREDELSDMRAVLVGAATEADVARIEREAAQKAEAAKKKSTSGRTSRGWTPPSRGGTAAREWNLPASEVTPIYASFIKKRNPRLTDTQALEIAQGIVGFSLHYGVDARLIMAMVMVESGFNPNVTSKAGAQGLGQLMPGTARGLGITNSFDTTQNLYGTVRIIRGHLDNYQRKTGEDFESLVLALAAYNAGPGAVRRHGGVPPYRETQNYVRKVISLYYELAGK